MFATLHYRNLRRCLPLLLAAGLLGVAGCYQPSSGPTTITTTAQPQGIQVIGEGRVTAIPDVAVINLGVEVTAPTVDQAYQDANRAMEALLVALKAAGIADRDRKTTQFSITPMRQFNAGQETLTGYRVNNMVSAKVRQLDQAGKIISQATSVAGNAVRVQSIQFTLDDPGKLQTQLRDLAMTDARAKADQLAKWSNLKLGLPTYIQEGSAPVTPRPVDIAQAARGGVAAEAPISPGELELHLQITITYATQP